MSRLRKYKVNEFLGAFVLFSYYYNFRGKGSYFESSYWKGIQRRNINMIASLQILAAVSAVYWSKWVRGDQRPTEGILTYKVANEPMSEILMSTFIGSSSLWAWTLDRVWVNAVILWVAASSTILALAGTFENINSSPLAILSITFLNVTVVLHDAVGWTARSLYLHLRNKRLK